MDKTLTEEASWYSPHNWKQRIIVPTAIAGLVGGGAGFVSKYRKLYALSQISATYAANFAIVTGCYCGAREFVQASRSSKHDDLLNSAIGGFGSGALLGRLQGGQAGAVRYSIMFAVVGTTLDYAALKLEYLRESALGGEGDPRKKKDSWMKLPEWSPIQVLDEAALAAKQAREEQLYGKRKLP